MRIFISHSWEEVNYYEEMVGLIDVVLGSDTWTNMSIPREKALNVLTAQSLRYEEEARRLEEALWNAEAALRDLSCEVAEELEREAAPSWLWQGRHHAKLIDGSTFTMPDTPKNQAKYPQQAAQKPGVGLPIARAVAIGRWRPPA